MKAKMTVKEFQELHGLKNPAEANGIINFLVSQGHAVHVENRRTTSGRGKPAKVYEISQEVTLKLFEVSDIEEITEARDEQDQQIAIEKAQKAAEKKEVETSVSTSDSKVIQSETSNVDDIIDPNEINLDEINLNDHVEFEEMD
jgi:predicted ArsR family transcriptional regulator